MKLIVQPDAGLVPIVRLIKGARRSIDLTIYRLDRKEVERALAEAVQRGVRVRSLIAHTNGAKTLALRNLEERLLAAGVTVTRSSDDLLRYHSKFMLADDTLHLFGFNFTKNDIGRSRSFAIATRDRRTLQEALKLFEADSSRQPYAHSPSNLVVSPDTSRPLLQKFLKGARRQLAIYDGKLEDPAMIEILKQRAAKGVVVRVLGNLKKPGERIEVRKLVGMRLHVRAIIRDGTRAFVGSQSLRQQELDARREIGLLISNPGVTRSLLKVFDADWERSAG